MIKNSSKIAQELQRHQWLYISLLIFCAGCIYINPFREVAISDEWAYAETVKHLATTGQYRLNDWLSANMPFQAYWGALFVKTFGFSFGILHFSTLLLTLPAIVAFYFLARAYGLSDQTSGFLTLCLIASPIFLFFCFTFMTDIPFLDLSIIALFCYTKAIENKNYKWMVTGGLFGCAACLTRQFGLALIGGLFFTWLLEQSRWKTFGFYICGGLLPAIAIGWQLSTGILMPNAAAHSNSKAQIDYVTNLFQFVGEALCWRPAVILEYLTLYTTPLLVVLIFSPFAQSKLAKFTAKNNFSFQIFFGKISLAVIFYLFISFFYAITRGKSGILLPYTIWNLDLLRDNVASDTVITSIVIIGTILNARILIEKIRTWSTINLSGKLLDMTALWLLGLLLVYVQIGDRYFLVLLPWWLLVLGRRLDIFFTYLKPIFLSGFLATFIISATWTVSTQTERTARWSAGENARAAGIPTDQIYPSWEWYSYYNFDTYINTHTGDLDFQKYIFDWLPEQNLSSKVIIMGDLHDADVAVPEDAQFSKLVGYQNGFFYTSYIKVFIKPPTP